MAREPQDDIAWGNVLRQHVGKPRTEGFFRSFYPPLTQAASALDAVRADRALDDAEGARLDLIGSIVGISRDIPNGIYLAFFGYAEQPAGRGYGQARYRADGEPAATSYNAPDAEYRSLIRAKIALNNGHGTAPEIVAALRHVYGVDLVSVRDGTPGAVEIWIGMIPSPDDQREFLVRDLLPRAAGVRINFNFFSPEYFGYAGQPGAQGYEQAPYARASSSNINPL
jgi:hypothetical protein